MASSLYSDQVTNLLAGTLNDAASALAVFPFSYTVPAATIAAGDTLFLTKIPKYFKPMLGFWTNTAGGAAATGKIGIYNATTYAVVDDDWLGALTDMTGITSQFFANTPAYHCGQEMAADYFVGVLTAAQAVAAAAQIHGWVMGRL
jgi:hypothetical protein